MDVELIRDYETLKRRADMAGFKVIIGDSRISFRNLHQAYTKGNEMGYASTIREGLMFLDGWVMNREFLLHEQDTDGKDGEDR